MNVEIPAELKAEVPQTSWGKVLSATPVVMAVLATLLAGLASSEMTRAQYARSLAAQQQSKAGDQWSFFQAKRLRGALQRNTVELLLNTTFVRPFDPAVLRAAFDQFPSAAKAQVSETIDSALGQQTLELLRKNELPPLPPAAPLTPSIQTALETVDRAPAEAEIADALARVSDRSLEEAVKEARERARAFDTRTSPINEVIEKLDQLLSPEAVALAQAGSGQPSTYRDFSVARLRYATQRYDAEARLNQAIASLYELQVRKSNILAERFRIRSLWFFLGMLGAQAGVIISTLAMAARKRNLLWSLAAAAGLVAVAFAIYVYFYI